MGAKRGERRQSAPRASPILWERMNHMENNDKVLEKVEDEKLEKTSGGAHINHIVCCTCGYEIPLGALHGNICPRCKGKARNL